MQQRVYGSRWQLSLRKGSMATVAANKTSLVARAFVGVVLLVPAALAFGLVYWYPALHVLWLSVQDAVWARPAGFVGLANYLHLLRDPVAGQAIVNTLLVVLLRLIAIVAIPALAGWSLARQCAPLRILGRLALSLPLLFSAPVALGLLWQGAVLRVPFLRGLSLANPSTALPSYLLLEFLTFLGFGGALTALALTLAWRPARPAKAVLGVLALAAILAVLSGLEAFSLPFVTTRGGPMNRTMTLPLYIFQTAFVRLQFGRAAAPATLLLAAGAGLGLLFGLLTEALDLKLVVDWQRKQRGISWWRLLVAVPAVGLLIAPILLLYLYAAGVAFVASEGALARASSSLTVIAGLLDGALVPVVTIVALQLPIAYAAAISLALVRPFGNLGSRVASAALVACGFVPSVVTGIGLYGIVRQLGLHDTLPALGLPLLAGPVSFYILKLYFAGLREAVEQAQRAGHSALTAFFKVAFKPSLPVAALAGAVSLLLSAQSLLWPLLVMVRREFFPLSLQLLAANLRDPAQQAAGAWLLLTCWGVGLLLLWWPLQALVVERLDLVAGERPPGDLEV